MILMEADKLVIFHKQIDLIQNCITRMAQNSFLLKTWTVSLLTIVIAIASKFNINGLLVGMIPVIVFWYLDSFFLQTEKMYRKMYDELIESNPDQSVNLKFYNLNPLNYKHLVDTRIQVMWSHTLKWFYLSLLIVTVLIFMGSHFWVDK